MSRGHGRVQRIILESVNATRYGCTVRQLAYLTHSIGRNDAPTEAQVVAVRRAVRQLIAEGHVVERVMFGTDRYILPAKAPVARPRQRPTSTRTHPLKQQTLQCLDCDLQWVSEEGAPHRLCWSCGEAGRPARSHGRSRVP